MHVVPMKVTPLNLTEYFRPKQRSEVGNKIIDIDPHFCLGPEGRPFSSRFENFYHDTLSIETAKHIFFTDFPSKQIKDQRDFFVIGELSFGTGLNFALACNYWKKGCYPEARLHYIAIEPYPLEVHQIDSFLSNFRELDLERSELVAVYPKPHTGFHRVWLANNKITLTLIVGSVDESLAELEAQVDTWFLDGFSLEKNPEIWSQNVCRELARLSRPKADLISINDDEKIQSRLTEQGFSLSKRDGFSAKRGILKGKFTGVNERQYLAPWLRPPRSVPSLGVIGIIGAGIAGCALAGALARRGKKALLFDQQGDVAQRASGIDVGLIAPQLGLNASDMNRFYDRAYRMTLQSVEDSNIDWVSRGVLQLFNENEAVRRVQFMKDRASLWNGSAQTVSPSQASSKIGLEISSHGIWFPDAGTLSPKNYAKFLSQESECLFGESITEFVCGEDGWELYGSLGQIIAKVDTLIVASAQNSKVFESTSFLPLSSLLGQISLVPSNKNSSKVKASVLGAGYFTPSSFGFHVVGSTYSRAGFDDHQWPQPVTLARHQENYKMLGPELASMFSNCRYDKWAGYSAIRSTTPDRLPVVGAVPKAQKFKKDFERLRHGPQGTFPITVDYEPNLFILAGLGSKGIMTSAISAELLASQMFGEPCPIERTLMTAVSPSRFLAREIQNNT